MRPDWEYFKKILIKLTAAKTQQPFTYYDKTRF